MNVVHPHACGEYSGGAAIGEAGFVDYNKVGKQSLQSKLLPNMRNNGMPSIARFRGITIYIYTETNAPHHLAHFHAYYGEYLASFAINPPGLLEGALPRRQLRFVLAWAELYQDELEENWQRVQSGELPHQIQGL